ncbi:M16 family metallopeptidase [Natranaerofaba carboxydovora]|uniref:M16 family metallopeptidase n=1 Tax=Natranaerofaba carboxydovora TaxID=2742683 RepID=UPI001F138748|nr:pitrilysin family protein [Natranaerofaba carboxydovora]UMZ73419.1 putative zinc protease [Natranaerofaba carboxydovora]
MYYSTNLDNKIEVIAEKVENIRSISLGIWLKSGSRFENPDFNGVSHFMEHMLFKGTKNRSPQDIANEIDDIAGEMNAFTTREYTCVYLKVIDEYFEKGLEIVADVFFNSVFPEEEIEKERQVILEEIKMYNDSPEDQVYDLMLDSCYGGHPLAFNVLGDKNTINNIDKNFLVDYYINGFLSRDIVISVAGNIEPQKATSIIKKYFDKKRLNDAHLNAGSPVYQTDDKYKYKDIEQAHYCLALPGIAYNDEKIYQLSLLNNILGGSMSSRLFQNVRELKGLAYSVYSYPLAFHDTGILIVYAGVSPENIEQTGEIIWDNLEGLAGRRENMNITSRELERAKAQVKGSIIFSLESTNSRMMRLGYSKLLKGKVFTPDEIIEKIDKIKLSDLEKLADQLFVPGKLSTALIGPVNNAYNPVK